MKKAESKYSTGKFWTPNKKGEKLTATLIKTTKTKFNIGLVFRDEKGEETILTGTDIRNYNWYIGAKYEITYLETINTNGGKMRKYDVKYDNETDDIIDFDELPF